MNSATPQIPQKPLFSYQSISHRYGEIGSVGHVSFDIFSGELVCLLGPSGCGKTTLLRLAAGFETPDTGTIHHDGQLISSPDYVLPPEKRRMGLVFQSYALFPHLTIYDNVRFGLPAQDAGAHDRVMGLLDELDVSEFAYAYPHELSGGQQQRVALARAIAPSPALILLDEPYSGLDSRLRERVRDRMLHILKSEGIAGLMVTHDAEEAMFMSDRIVVMNKGQVVQQGRPIDLYCRPQNAFVAEFFGEVNYIPAICKSDDTAESIFGTIDAPGLKKGDEADIILRHEGVDVLAGNNKGVVAQVVSSHLLGRTTLVHLSVDCSDTQQDVHLHARLPGLNFIQDGEKVSLGCDLSQLFVFPRQSGR